jgi:hypothetical protein
MSNYEPKYRNEPIANLTTKVQQTPAAPNSQRHETRIR